VDVVEVYFGLPGFFGVVIDGVDVVVEVGLV